MKYYYVFNRFGVNEMFSKEECGVEMVMEEEWDEIEVESNIIKEYKVFDGVGRLLVEDECNEEEVLEEVDRLDELIF